MWRRVLVYGLLLAGGTAALQWVEYQRLARAHGGDLLLFVVALGFLVLGLAVGWRLVPSRPAPVPQPAPTPDEPADPTAPAELGISPRELTVLQELAAGYSNKEIADRLHVSPHTVKTHVAHLYEKLGARRRTEAVHKARSLGLVR